MELNPGYKQTEVGVIPEDWDCVHIGDVAETSSGATPSRAKQQEYFDGGTIPWVKTLDLNNSSILETDECITPSALQQTSLRLYPRGSVLIAMYGGFNQIGRTGILTSDATINQALTAIRPDQSRLSSKFLLNYLNFRVEYWKSVASSSRKDPNITGRDVREFPVPLPPLREQETAGEVLRDFEDQIFMFEGLIAKKTYIKQAAMQELLTGKRRLPGFEGEWGVKRLGDSALLKARIGWQGLTTAEYLSSGNYFLVTGTEFESGYIAWNECHFVDEERYKQDKYIQLRPRDILVTKDGTIGKVAIVTDLPGPATLNSGIFVIRPLDNAFNPEFFYYLLCSQVFSEFLGQLAAGSTINHLYQKDFVSFSYRTPPTIEEQAAIANILNCIDSELITLKTRLNKTRAIKQGMMQELLTGKVRLI